jgi:hypothetical protein
MNLHRFKSINTKNYKKNKNSLKDDHIVGEINNDEE